MTDKKKPKKPMTATEAMILQKHASKKASDKAELFASMYQGVTGDTLNSMVEDSIASKIPPFVPEGTITGHIAFDLAKEGEDKTSTGVFQGIKVVSNPFLKEGESYTLNGAMVTSDEEFKKLAKTQEVKMPNEVSDKMKELESKYGSLDIHKEVFNFGKYHGMTIPEVLDKKTKSPIKGKGWIKWVITEAFDKGSTNQEFIKMAYLAQQYLKGYEALDIYNDVMDKAANSPEPFAEPHPLVEYLQGLSEDEESFISKEDLETLLKEPTFVIYLPDMTAYDYDMLPRSASLKVVNKAGVVEVYNA